MENGFSPAQIRDALSLALASRQFADSPRLSAFLQYIVEKALAGQSDQIKEYTIATEVFERPAAFDPRLDTIVRVQATKLRSRLNEFYASDANDIAVRIQLPRGSYVPVFELHEIGVSQRGEPIPAVSAKPATGTHRLLWVVLATVTVGAFAIGFAAASRLRSKQSGAAPIRFTVAPPGDHAFRGFPQVSPDGRSFVCTITGKGGATALYLHSLEAGTGHVRAGTDGAHTPYWSADGKWVLFTVAGELKKLDVASGASPSVVARADSGAGADCNREGVVLLGSFTGALQAGSASGGPFRTATALDRQRNEVAHSFPKFLPDGKHFLYLARSEVPRESAIFVSSLDGKVRKRLLPSEAPAQFVPARLDGRSHAGYLLYVHGRDLVAHPFDSDTLEVTGDYQRIDGDLSVFTYGQSAFSVSSTGVVVYSKDPGVSGELKWVDRNGRVAGVLGTPGFLGDPVISPDGTFVAFDRAEESNRDIWTIEIATGKLMRLTFDPEIDHCPVWSPDGAHVAFESHRSSSGVYVKDSRGAGAEWLLAKGGFSAAWTPDGRFVVSTSMQPVQDPGGIWLLPIHRPRTPERWIHSENNERHLAVSPDGRWIAYTASESGQVNVFVRRFDPFSPSTPDKWQISVDGGSQPVWRGDGKELFFLSRENVVMAAAVTTGQTFHIQRPVALFDTGVKFLRGPCRDYDTRDGRRFVVRAPAQRTPGPPLHVLLNWEPVLNQ